MFAVISRSSVCARSHRSHSILSHPLQGRTYSAGFSDPKDTQAVFRKRTDFMNQKNPYAQKAAPLVDEGIKDIFDKEVRAREEILGTPLSQADKTDLWNACSKFVIPIREKVITLEPQLTSLKIELASKNSQELKTRLLLEVAATESARMKVEIFNDIMSALTHKKMEPEIFKRSGVSSEDLHKNSVQALRTTFHSIFYQIEGMSKVSFSKERIDGFWQLISDKRLCELQERIVVRMQKLQSQEAPILRNTLIKEFAQRQIVIMGKDAQIELFISKTWKRP